MDDGRSPVVVADVFEEGSGIPATLERLGVRVVVEPLSVAITGSRAGR
jgi:ERCC4-type nuclease